MVDGSVDGGEGERLVRVGRGGRRSVKQKGKGGRSGRRCPSCIRGVSIEWCWTLVGTVSG